MDNPWKTEAAYLREQLDDVKKQLEESQNMKGELCILILDNCKRLKKQDDEIKSLKVELKRYQAREEQDHQDAQIDQDTINGMLGVLEFPTIRAKV